VIGRIRKALSSAFGRGAEGKAPRDEGDTDAGRRIEAAKRRLKKAIPPPED
jgi:hypothetical protein